jgi:hypothetical protein
MKTVAEALLQKLAKWRPEGRQSLEVVHPESGWTVTVDAGHVEALGCRVWEVRLQRSSLVAAADLKGQAETVASRVTGLLEPLRLVEVDAAGGAALLRSAKAAAWGDGLFYYELVLGADSAMLRRYQAPGTESPHRQQVPFTLTHEVLAKLVTDLSDR